MKKLTVLFVLTFCLLNTGYSQENTKVKEVGLYFSNFDAFGIRYKIGNNKSMFRLTALSLSAEIGKDENSSIKSFFEAGIGLNIGLELPVSISEKFNLIYGGELRLAYNYSKSKTTSNIESKVKGYDIGIGLVLGFAYNISSNISLSAEMVPSFSYEYSKSGGSTNNAFGFGLSNNSVGLTLGYKF